MDENTIINTHILRNEIDHCTTRNTRIKYGANRLIYNERIRTVEDNTIE